MLSKYKIGSDIELFLRDINTKEIVSSEGIIKGTKNEPFYFDKNNKYHATSLDNVSSEFNVSPSETPYEFYKSVETCINYINSIIPKNLEIAALPSARINPKYLQTETTKTLGCSATWNAWTGMENEPPNGEVTNLRTNSFHLHVGYENPSEFMNREIVKVIDIFVGIPSVLIEPANERRTLYGKAGEFRPQKHGVEARCLSGYFASSKELIEWAFRNTQDAIEFLNNGGMNRISSGYEELIQNTINFSDKQAASQLVEEFGIKLVA